MNKNNIVPRNVFENELIELQPNLYSFALSLTADTHRAEDLTQDTTLKVLSNREKYQANTNFKGWVFTVMRNLFINNYHRLVRTQKIFDTNADISYMGSHFNSEGLGSPDHEISLKEINQAIDQLDATLKEPFSMYVAGYKYKEIAEVLDIPLGTVKSRIFMARKELQETLVDFR